MRAKYYDRNSLFRITLQVFLDRFVEREIQSLLVHCIHQEEGCDWKDELRKREVTNKLQWVSVGLVCSCETQKTGHL